jgi:hypothetical protein
MKEKIKLTLAKINQLTPKNPLEITDAELEQSSTESLNQTLHLLQELLSFTQSRLNRAEIDIEAKKGKKFAQIKKLLAKKPAATKKILATKIIQARNEGKSIEAIQVEYFLAREEVVYLLDYYGYKKGLINKKKGENNV